ncbi:MAG: recombination mediator RecR [Spirochaetes bacterium]|jgi:recombination protein RecR|nr:recombination mediator RecR [Spirochaetota bacterium]
MGGPSNYLDALIREFTRLPGIGPKSASRLAFHILKASEEEVERLTGAISELKKNISFCNICGGISDGQVCAICSDDSRDKCVICVVEEAKDILTIEKSMEYRGLYHVLKGVISPLDGIGPEDLNIVSFLNRCRDGTIKEIVIATNPTIEGDATTLYLARILKPLGIKVMRIAHGLPAGSNLEFADSATIAKSLAGRIEIL